MQIHVTLQTGMVKNSLVYRNVKDLKHNFAINAKDAQCDADERNASQLLLHVEQMQVSKKY